MDTVSFFAHLLHYAMVLLTTIAHVNEKEKCLKFQNFCLIKNAHGTQYLTSNAQYSTDLRNNLVCTKFVVVEIVQKEVSSIFDDYISGGTNNKH